MYIFCLNTMKTNTTVSQPVGRSVVANDQLHYGLIHNGSEEEGAALSEKKTTKKGSVNMLILKKYS